jgi:hypothetical protein
MGTLSVEKQEKLEKDAEKAEKKAEKKAELEAKKKDAAKVGLVLVEDRETNKLTKSLLLSSSYFRTVRSGYPTSHLHSALLNVLSQPYTPTSFGPQPIPNYEFHSLPFSTPPVITLLSIMSRPSSSTSLFTYYQSILLRWHTIFP